MLTVQIPQGLTFAPAKQVLLVMEKHVKVRRISDSYDVVPFQIKNYDNLPTCVKYWEKVLMEILC